MDNAGQTATSHLLILDVWLIQILFNKRHPIQSLRILPPNFSFAMTITELFIHLNWEEAFTFAKRIIDVCLKTEMYVRVFKSHATNTSSKNMRGLTSVQLTRNHIFKWARHENSVKKCGQQNNQSNLYYYYFYPLHFSTDACKSAKRLKALTHA